MAARRSAAERNNRKKAAKTPAPRPPVSGGLPQWLVVLLLLAAATVPYLNSLEGSFHFDDDQLVQNEHLTDLPALLAECPKLRALAFLTFYGNARLHGLGWMPGWHAVNILLHAACVLAAYWLFTLLARRTEQTSATPRKPIWPLLGAVLFAVHPLASEPVNYILQRTAIMYSVFTLLAVCGTILALEARTWTRLATGLLLIVGAVEAATMSKEVGVFFAVAAPLLYLCIAAPKLTRAQRWCILVGGATAAIGLGVVLWRFGGADAVWQRLSGPMFRQHLWAQTIVFWRYLWLAVLPLPGSLTVDHYIPYVPTRTYHGFDEDVLPATLALLVMIAVAVFLKWKDRLTAMLILLVPLTLAPYFVLPSPEMMVEYRFYLPLIAICGLAGLLLERAVTRKADHLPTPSAPVRRSPEGVVGSEGRKRRTPCLPTGLRAWAICGYAGLVLLLAAGTWQRNHVWRSELTLWQDAYAKAPRKARTVSGLAWALLKDPVAPDPKRGLELALRSVNRSKVDLPPGFNPHMMDTLAEAYFANGYYAEAISLEKQIIARGWKDPYFARQLARFEAAATRPAR